MLNPDSCGQLVAKCLIRTTAASVFSKCLIRTAAASFGTLTSFSRNYPEGNDAIPSAYFPKLFENREKIGGGRRHGPGAEDARGPLPALRPRGAEFPRELRLRLWP